MSNSSSEYSSVGGRTKFGRATLQRTNILFPRERREKEKKITWSTDRLSAARCVVVGTKCEKQPRGRGSESELAGERDGRTEQARTGVCRAEPLRAAAGVRGAGEVRYVGATNRGAGGLGGVVGRRAGGGDGSKDAGRQPPPPPPPPQHDIPTLRPTRSNPTTSARVKKKKERPAARANPARLVQPPRLVPAVVRKSFAQSVRRVHAAHRSPRARRLEIHSVEY